MKKSFLFIFIIFISVFGFCQNKNKNQEVDFINHQVELGETVRMISKKYLVDPAIIYQLNKFAVNGITQGMVLVIPVPRKEETPILENKEEATAQNVEEKQKIISKPLINSSKDTNIANEDIYLDRTAEINYTVVDHETLYSIARNHGVSVDELKLRNQDILVNGLKTGQVLIIPVAIKLQNNESSSDKPSVKADVPKKETEVTKEETSDNSTITHVVAPKETLFGLSKKYNVSIDEINKQNSLILKDGLKVGQVLIIPSNK